MKEGQSISIYREGDEFIWIPVCRNQTKAHNRSFSYQLLNRQRRSVMNYLAMEYITLAFPF